MMPKLKLIAAYLMLSLMVAMAAVRACFLIRYGIFSPRFDLFALVIAFYTGFVAFGLFSGGLNRVFNVTSAAFTDALTVATIALLSGSFYIFVWARRGDDHFAGAGYGWIVVIVLSAGILIGRSATMQGVRRKVKERTDDISAVSDAFDPDHASGQ